MSETAEATPSVETPTPPVEQTVEPVIESPTEEVALDNSKNPERTKEYIESLKQKIETLESSKQEPLPSALESLKPQPTTEVVATEGETKDGYMDNEGYIDNVKLNQALSAAKQEAEEAKRVAAQNKQNFAKFEETQQTKAVHSKYPQLDPKSDTFDKRFYDLVKNDLVGQMMNGERDFMQAADKMNSLLTPVKEQVEREEKAEVTQEQKRQINSTPSRAPKQTTATHAELVQGTLKNKPGALAARMAAAGY